MHSDAKNEESFWWNVQKLFSLNDALNPIANDMFKSFYGKEFAEVLSLMEEWQKDLCLNSFLYWGNNIKDEDKKQYLKLLINSGAKICKPFISMKVADEDSKTRIIDRIQTLYESIHKPFEITTYNKKKELCYKIAPNTPLNRLIIENNHYVWEMNIAGFDVDTFFELLKNNGILPDVVEKEMYRIYDIKQPDDYLSTESFLPNVVYAWETIRDDIFRVYTVKFLKWTIDENGE